MKFSEGGERMRSETETQHAGDSKKASQKRNCLWKNERKTSGFMKIGRK